MAHILVIDDDTDILQVIRMRLEANGYLVETFSNPLDALESAKERHYDVVVTDIRMPQIDGVELLRRLRELDLDVPVILLTAYGTIPSAVEAIRLGAFHYLTKPFQGKELVEEIKRAIGDRKSGETVPSEGKMHFSGVFGVSPKMKILYQLIERITDTDSTVLIQGESGTGKELIAKMIHSNGHRRDNEFVIVDCGATPASLIESELFGHTRGSFTNATESRKGLFDLANKGTLFLDEIGSMPLDLQTRLLRVLQEGQIKKIGENQMRKVDVRVLAATNVDLRQQVTKGLFRLDLYYRLAVLNLALPPLRERTEDIPLLADYFLSNFSRRMKVKSVSWDEGVIDVMREYSWPGNIRELKNVIEAGLVYCKGDVMTLDDLYCAGFTQECGEESYPLRTEIQEDDLSLPESLEKQERGMILKALEGNNWIQKDAANQLGISPRVLCYKIKKLKIEVSPENEEIGDSVSSLSPAPKGSSSAYS